MWYLLTLARRKDREYQVSAEDLFLHTARLLIGVMMIAYCVWHVVATQFWPETFGGTLWFIAFVILPTCGLALWLLKHSLLAASVVWIIGLMAGIALAAYLFRSSEVTFLYAFLPLLAVVMIGAPAALPMVAVVIGLVGWTAHWPAMPPLSTAQQWLVVSSGAMGALIGWASSAALTTTTEWSLRHFVEARDALKQTQHHRAQLADMVKSLDQAYYRLERANAALVAARKQAEDAERAKTEFITNVSHELRTPLNLIVGFSEVMLTAPESYDGVPLPGGYRSDLSAIYNAAQHLLALVDDILDMARIEAGKMSLVHEHTDLAALIEEAAATMRDYVHLKGLQLCLDLAPNLPMVWVDRLRIRQVVLNLLVNAARFTDRGGITIGCRLEQPADHDAAPPMIRVSVSDTGRGIPAGDLPKIFEAFRATEQPMSAWHSGTGLGLPISKQFVELHGGHMGVSSEPGKGSTFWFTLPCSGPVEGTLATSRHSPYVPLGQTERIIVVVHEDARIAGLVQRHLGRCRVLHAPDFDTGTKLADEVKALAVLVDHRRPLPRRSLPPAASQTTVVQCPLPNQREIAQAFGVHDVLVKPITRHDLIRALERLPAQPRTVLVVDDDPKMVRLLQRMLRMGAGLDTILAAHSGDEALAVLRAHAVDAVLLDLVMPDVDGLAVLRRMAEAGLATVPVIMISGHAHDHARLPLRGPLAIHRADGFQLAELMRVIETGLSILEPGWQALNAAPPATSAPPTNGSDSPVSSNSRPRPVASPAPVGGSPSR